MPKYEGIVSSLTFDAEKFYKKFAADFELHSSEDDVGIAVDEKRSAATEETVRPVTPIESSIKLMPKAIHEFKSIIHKRLHINDDSEYISHNDQQELASTLISEVNAAWPDMCKQAPDPFLSAKDNKELERRVAITVVCTVENLFKQYIEKVKAANKLKIFNPTSNICRLKTQLAFDANKRLNILNIRRKLATALRHPSENSDGISEDSFIVKVKNKLTDLSVNTTGRLSRKMQMTRKMAEELNRQTELDDLTAKMPLLKKYELIDHSPTKFHKAEDSNLHSPKTTNAKEQQNASNSTLKSYCDSGHSQVTSRLQKSKSLPQIHAGRVLLEELDINKNELSAIRSTSTMNMKLPSSIESNESQQIYRNLEQSACQDLQQLLKDNVIAAMDKKDNHTSYDFHDIPPLLQALPLMQKRITIKKDIKVSQMCNSNASIDIASSLSRDILETGRISHVAVQPAAVTKFVPRKGCVRLSDVRPSNRQNSCEITLKKHGAIYNDFKGEVNDETTKWLDRNLFAGEEIKEVFEEIVKTINKEHLQFERDEFVVSCPSSLRSKQSFASDLLHNTDVNKIWNQNIIACPNPPWGTQSADEWRNSPKFGGLGRQEILQMKADAYKELVTQESSYSRTLHKKPTKSYSAWLAWWRSTINTEDFYKYISIKDNDFLSRVFHLYESDKENVDKSPSQLSATEDAETIAKNKLIKERQSKLQKLKNEFINGYWNVNCVYMGGLGRAACEAGMEEEPQSTNKSQISLQPPDISIQDRLERIWKILRMPENCRLDMAIKYSLYGNCEQLCDAIECWEIAADRIVEREEMLAALERFEEKASDPNRFFQKGQEGLCIARLDESKTRHTLHERLQCLDSSVRKAVHDVEETFNEKVTFEGRPYLEKMTNDKTEMLYWLQQERRGISIRKDSVLLQQRGKCSELPPIAALELL